MAYFQPVTVAIVQNFHPIALVEGDIVGIPGHVTVLRDHHPRPREFRRRRSDEVDMGPFWIGMIAWIWIGHEGRSALNDKSFCWLDFPVVRL